MAQDNCGSSDKQNPLVLLENSMTEELQSLSPLSLAYSICKVPTRLLKGNEEAYTPQIVSIGPFHHGKEDLKAMEECKKRYLKIFLEWTNLRLGFFINAVKEKEESLRACYQEAIGFSSEKFVKLILLDAAFIVVFLIKGNFAYLKDEHDCIFDVPLVTPKVRLDMLLFENQLPFFILVEFFGHVRLPSQTGETPSILRLCHNLFSSLMYLVGTEEKLENIQPCNVAHILDLVRCMLVPLNGHPRGEIETLHVPTITELHKAGVRFEVGLGSNFDLRFNKGILEITRCRLGPEDEIIFRNLIAFEHVLGGSNYISDCITVLSRLLKIQDDVDLPIKYKILDDSKHNNKTQLSLIYELGSNTWFRRDRFPFAGLCEQLNDYCSKQRHKWIANLKQNYFSTPWTTISVIAGFVLLVLSLIQTVCSVISAKSSNQNGNQH